MTTPVDTLTIIKQILDREMSMPTGRVFAYNGEEGLPKDNDLFIVLYYTARTPYANKLFYKEDTNTLKEKQAINIMEEIEIAVMSKNIDAITNSPSVFMALKSTYSQMLQEQNKLHISTIGEMFDNSFLEATSRYNRFDIRCRVIRCYNKEGSVDYYDKFPNTSTFEPEYKIQN